MDFLYHIEDSLGDDVTRVSGTYFLNDSFDSDDRSSTDDAVAIQWSAKHLLQKLQGYFKVSNLNYIRCEHAYDRTYIVKIHSGCESASGGSHTHDNHAAPVDQLCG
jgi:hypothetical protein